MPQIRLDPSLLNGDSFILEGPEAHHLVRVLRRKSGDEIQLFDGRGNRYHAVLGRIDDQIPRVEGRITGQVAGKSNKIILALYQGLPRGSKFDYVIEKATELGVDEIIPFLSEKSVVRLKDFDQSPKLARWERVAEAASKQCDRSSVPRLEPARPLKELKWDRIGGSLLVLTQTPGARSLKSLRDTVLKLGLPGRFNLVVGPESGFSKFEMERLVQAGGIPISLGELTLRTETAGLAALSILRYELEI